MRRNDLEMMQRLPIRDIEPPCSGKCVPLLGNLWSAADKEWVGPVRKKNNLHRQEFMNRQPDRLQKPALLQNRPQQLLWSLRVPKKQERANRAHHQ